VWVLRRDDGMFCLDCDPTDPIRRLFTYTFCSRTSAEKDADDVLAVTGHRCTAGCSTWLPFLEPIAPRSDADIADHREERTDSARLTGRRKSA
jgi:hypothetical protein